MDAVVPPVGSGARWTTGERRLLAEAFLAALILGLGVLLHFGRRGLSDLVYDEKSYSHLAISLWQRHVYDDTYRAPGYPFFVALVYGIFGLRPVAVFALHGLLFLAQLWLTFRLALRITRHRGQALLTLWLCALWPPFYEAIPILYTEVFFAVQLGLSLWLLYQAMDRSSWRWGAAAGVALGLAVLTKAVLLPFVGLAFLLLLGRRFRQRAAFSRGAALVLGAVLVLGPWTYHNYRITGAVVPVSTGGGFNFWQGNWPGMYEHPWKWNDFPAPLDSLVAGKGEVEKDKILFDAGLGYVKENPLRGAGLLARKFGILWLGGLGINPAGLGDAHMLRLGTIGLPKRAVAHVPLFFLALYGWIRLSTSAKRRARPLAVLFLLWTVSYVAIVATARYALPLAYYEILLASVGLWGLGERFAAMRRASLGGSGRHECVGGSSDAVTSPLPK